MLAMGSGHKPRTLLNAYAIDSALPTRLQSELLELYSRLSRAWQDWNETYYLEHSGRATAQAAAAEPPLQDSAGASYSRSHTIAPLLRPTPKPPRPQPTCREGRAQLGPTTIPSLEQGFRLDEQYGVLICLECQACVVPGVIAVDRHLRRHGLRGEALKVLCSKFAEYDLAPPSEVQGPTAAPPPILGLRVQKGYRCNVSCTHQTINEKKMREHVSAKHGLKPQRAQAAGQYQECYLQAFFASQVSRRYFEVTPDRPADEEEKALFIKLEEDYQDIKGDIEEQASIVHDFADSREVDAGAEGATDPNLVRILGAAKAMLRDAYKLCSDTSPERKMTQQRANILNEFYARALGKADGFWHFKNPSTLVTYFTTMKQLLVYYYRVVHCEGGHFTRAKLDQVLLRDVIRLTKTQIQAMDEIMAALAVEDAEEAGLALKHAIRRLYLAMICHTVGSVPFKSPVLSFCAMLSRKVRGKGRGLWEEPGNFNSHLSALTWVAQLVIFDYACFHEQDDEDQIPVFLARMCKKFFQQLAETPFGHILQWRLYLFKVGKAAIVKHQARWSLDRQTVEYRGVELQMTQISQLILSEYQKAHSLLWDELLFGGEGLVPMESWRLKDDLDLEDFGGSWLSHPSNSELLDGAELALFRRIQGSAKLRAMFLTTAADGSVILCPKAMKIYEAHAQDLLGSGLILCHVPPGPPLRASELLSQSGVYKDNIRFLQKAIGDLLLMYIAYVIPLRQMFLQQQTPGALISLYLWSKLDGTVWADDTLAACLAKACTRAQVPRFKTARWRQFAASITKEKFAANVRANFDVEDNLGDDIEDELDLVALAELSNHSYHTFNHAYAGTTTLTMNTLLHRSYRASESWRTLFGLDLILQGKRPRGVSDTLSLRMLDASKRGQMRRKGAYSEADLLTVARKLHSAPNMKFRVPGQRRGVLAVMGPQPAEQVVLILGVRARRWFSKLGLW
ncbi:hypothetical protein V498_00910 [Pseudogymnoascus sp. VKM F-4517 (FW-2822)]|nr:hypothetical protein V498_00910 [Pseudogymnoascus sp. VKM F-4517 (FW-2822)]